LNGWASKVRSIGLTNSTSLPEKREGGVRASPTRKWCEQNRKKK